MGDWNTLHVFDDRRFHEETVPRLRGEKAGLEEHHARFLKTSMPRCDIGVDEMIPVFRQFSADFTRHPGYDALLEQDRHATFERIHPREFYIRRFFEFVLFSECANFFPYFKMGYRLFHGAVGVKEGDTAMSDLVLHLSHGGDNNPWRWDGDGIRSWLSAREVKALNDSGSIVPRKEEDADYVQDFLRFLDVVTKNNLGLLSAANINSDPFKNRAPPVRDEDLWKGVEIERLIREE
ncbi:hypothetical protein HPC49_04300 [Pyxidicoccus fallax]|uniref:Uncharacterized protein n=1 Tax=Pyxidicoccus fallax TaxID=394095 RepID=A0A848L983_9BACT|nr:hypothetical protein [Pyxidicoccus fallax]NMO15127.1 hypothetical protein [Pyxidicoccus fallax]NPC77473.1 hypothetical protein [Pyxidicoccus fallax]